MSAKRFIPFLVFHGWSGIIYTTNAIVSLTYQLRKIIKKRRHFPNETRWSAAVARDPQELLHRQCGRQHQNLPR